MSQDSLLYMLQHVDVQESTFQQKQRLSLLLDRALGPSLFHRQTHLRIMRQASAHVAACDYDEMQAISCQGPGGDLFFVLQQHRMLFPWRH